MKRRDFLRLLAAGAALIGFARGRQRVEAADPDAGPKAFHAALNPMDGNIPVLPRQLRPPDIIDYWAGMQPCEQQAARDAYAARHDVRESIAAYGMAIGAPWFNYDRCAPEFRDHWESVAKWPEFARKG